MTTKNQIETIIPANSLFPGSGEIKMIISSLGEGNWEWELYLMNPRDWEGNPRAGNAGPNADLLGRNFGFASREDAERAVAIALDMYASRR